MFFVKKQVGAGDMLNTVEIKNFEQNIRDLSKKNNEPQWLLNKRLGAYNIFKSMPMPNFIYGLNISMNIELDLDLIDADKAVNSKLEVTNNDTKIIIEDFKGMLKNHESILKDKFMSIVGGNEKFTSFHASFLNNLIFVYVPKNVEVKEPIEISSIIGQGVLFEHLIVLAEDNAKLTLIEDSKPDYSSREINNDKTNTLNNNKNNNSGFGETKNSPYGSKIVELFIGKNCNVNYGNAQLLDKSAFNFTIKKASVGANSTLNWMDCCFGSKVTLSEVATLLDGEGAATNNHSVFFGSKNQQFDLVAKSIHNAPHTVSDILTKGALTENAKCLYRGLVRIEKNAFGSNGYQKEDTLLLSSDASADSIPNLEIENNDVRCTHGASIGRIDREKLFYMMSRGLPEELATREYVKAFFEPLIQKIQIEKLRENMHEMIGERMR